jgi:hypothetical protein
LEDKGMVNQILIRPANSHISSTLTLRLMHGTNKAPYKVLFGGGFAYMNV